MNWNDRTRRWATLLAAGVIVTLATAVVGKATQTISTPNATSVFYSLASGASSPVVYPPANTPVMLIGTQLAVGYRGVANVSLLRISGSFLEWTGLESPSAAAITQGFSGATGTHIVYLDFSHQVDVQVSGTDAFVIHNASSSNRFGNVTLIW